jgi:hypothetical protein
MEELAAFYAIKKAVERCRPELVGSIQGRQEIEGMTREIIASIREAGLYFVNQFEKDQVRTRRY